jgi:hypothetical protein
MRRFKDNPDNSEEKQAAYKEKLVSLDDHALFEECGKMIWLSAYAANNPASCYHWQCDSCYAETERRGKGGTGGIYDRAHKSQMKAEGY